MKYWRKAKTESRNKKMNLLTTKTPKQKLEMQKRETHLVETPPPFWCLVTIISPIYRFQNLRLMPPLQPAAAASSSSFYLLVQASSWSSSTFMVKRISGKKQSIQVEMECNTVLDLHVAPTAPCLTGPLGWIPQNTLFWVWIMVKLHFGLYWKHYNKSIFDSIFGYPTLKGYYFWIEVGSTVDKVKNPQLLL